MRRFQRGIGVVGAGRLGMQLLMRANDRGVPCRRLRSRTPPTLPPSVCVDILDTWDRPVGGPWPRLVVIAVPDRAIGHVAERLADTVDLANAVVLHTAGALTAEVLAICRPAGATIASWHPLQTFPRVSPRTTHAAQWDRVPCAIEGDHDAVEEVSEMSRHLGLHPWLIRAADKPLYHAAAAVAGNLGHALVAAASDLMDDCALPRTDDGRSGLAHLVEASLAAALSAEPWTDLTGAAARGDDITVETHLSRLPEPLAEAYRSLAPMIRRRVATTCED